MSSLLASKCLKIDQIQSDNPVNRIERIQELLNWFERLALGQANPKWLEGHAFELAYYLKTNNNELKIDFEAGRKKAFFEGLQTSDELKQFILSNNS